MNVAIFRLLHKMVRIRSSCRYLWAISGANSPPFDKDFYLIMSVPVGDGKGWIPVMLGGKPVWYGGSEGEVLLLDSFRMVLI